jgi:hypothetical protein
MPDNLEATNLNPKIIEKAPQIHLVRVKIAQKQKRIAPPEDDGVPEALELKDAAGSNG